MNPNYWILGGLVTITILFAITDFDPIESAIPPTPAFKLFNGTWGNITASQYDDFAELKEGSGISLSHNYTLNELTITSTGGGGINNTISSLGIGHSIVSGQVLIDHQLKGIFCAGDLLCSTNSTDLRISYTDGVGTGEANTQSSPTQANSLVLPKVGVDLPIKGIACGGSIICSSNSTDVTLTYTATGGGNVTNLNDAGDVVLTSPSINSILQLVNGYWIDKVFSINTQTASNDIFITAINNQTGVITTNQFSVNTQSSSVDRQITGINNATGEITRNTFSVNLKTCSGTDKVSSIDNSTGNVICSTDATGAGTARESTVATWTVDSTKTNIGTAFINVYTTGLGDPLRIDTNGKTTASLIIDWTKVGTGTQKCVIRSTTAPSIEIISFANVVSGLNTNATFDIPTNAENRIDTFVPMCKSTTAGDDPLWLTGQVLLR